jgi:hypothetical protein
VKKVYLSLLSILLTSCAGYQPLYGELGQQMDEIGLAQVQMANVKKDVGERRLAQQLSQKLGRIFTNTVDNDYDLYVILTIEEEAISTRFDDTDQRKSVAIIANMQLKEKDTNKVKFETSLSRSSSYTTQEEPFATQAARTKALESVVSALSGDIVQRSALWFRGYEANENY